ncbi:peroxidase family protein [Alsobacter sp. R-9]
MVTLVRNDLEFILQQIRIAEANSLAHSLETGETYYADLRAVMVDGVRVLVDPHLPYGLRYVDGSNNNLIPGRETYGSADQTMPEMLGSVDRYPDGLVSDAAPRLISNLISDQTPGNRAAVIAAFEQQGLPVNNAVVDQIVADWQAVAAADATVRYLELIDRLVDRRDTTGPAAPTAGELAGINAQLAAISTAPAVASLLSAAVGETWFADLTAPGADALRTTEIADARTAATTLGSDFQADVAAAGLTLDGKPGLPTSQLSLVIPNVSPDEGLTAPFNSWMTLFGQFFDHGLDLIPKDSSVNVLVPLAEDDPLYVPGGRTNFMVLNRAVADQQGREMNLTTPWIDQNQTYTSHASHQAFLREYEIVGGRVVTTGHLLEGAKRDAEGRWLDASGNVTTVWENVAREGLATWKDIKEQAEFILGIRLVDTDIFSVPLLVTDPYGQLILDANGNAQLVKGNPAAPTFVSGNRTTPVDTAGSISTKHAFLDDIAHDAVPNFVDHDRNPLTAPQAKTADSNDAVGLSADRNEFGVVTSYDNELLDRHFITGDGRGNENIGLTTVHYVFHAEHNRQVEAIKQTVLQSGDLAFINQWLATDVTVVPASTTGLNWDGERLFQAARFATEMQYQHLVFEEFGRRVQPAIDLFIFNNITEIDPAIVAEFAHVVYRFGHSMLDEQVTRLDVVGTGANQSVQSNDIDLIGAFLNPVEFTADYGGSQEEAAAAIVRGMTRQTGNEIDEFVTDALRNNLVGLPLDLAALNLARGRDTGVPTLQEARATFFEQSGSQWVKPYTSWIDFAQNINNPASIVNFIAAYGTHASIVAADTVEEKRDAAMLLAFGGAGAPADRMDFLYGRNAYASSLGGLNDVDYWIGGLAEKKMPFGGMLGSSFMYVFEAQMQNLQNADRFYYLSRTQGLNILNELENNSFASLIMKNTGMGEGTGPHLPGDVFSSMDYTLEVNQNWQQDYNGAAPGKDPTFDPTAGGSESVLAGLGLTKVIRDNPNTVANEALNANGVLAQGATGNYLQFIGGEHVVLGGTNQNDTLVGDDGDDALWGDGGDDVLIGGAGVNRLHGKSGDDTIIDGGDISFLHGEDGNDVIHAGAGAGELIFGGAGSDFINMGEDAKEAFGGLGNDFILGTAANDFILGNEGDDWIEGGDGFDGIAGDNSELFFNSKIIGHDVMFAGPNEQDFDAESGDDIMVQGESVIRNEGMMGFDWVTHKDVALAADVNLARPIFTNDAQDILRNRYDKVEGASGWRMNDVIIGDDRVRQAAGADAEAGADGATPGLAETTLFGDELTEAGLDRIAGFRQLMVQAGWTTNTTPVNSETQVVYADGNVLMGGAGSDTITGRGGDDVIDGDSWLNVRINVTIGNVVYTTDSLTRGLMPIAGTAQLATLDPATGKYALPPNAALPFDGRPLHSLLLDGTVKTSQMSIVREIIDGDTGNSAIDVADYSGNIADYTIRRDNGGVRIIDNRGIDSSSIGDYVRNVEMLSFADGQVSVQEIFARPFDAIRIVNQNDTGPGLRAVAENLQGNPALTYQWQQFNGTNWVNIATGVNLNNPPRDVEIRVVVSGAGFSPVTSIEQAIVATAGVEDLIDATDVPTVILGLDQDDRLSGGVAADLLVGGADNDRLDGGDGNDTLRGGDGDDILIGRTGNNVLIGGAGDDDLSGGHGNDSLDGGADTDNANMGLAINAYAFSRVGTVVTVTDNAGAEGDGVDTLQNVETLTDIDGTLFNLIINGAGTAAQDVLVGDAGANTLTGGGANDIVFAGAGNDRIVVALADGADTIFGGEGTDTLAFTGNGTDETISGAGGNLTRNGVSFGQTNGVEVFELTGAGGNDTLTGSDGADRFIWSVGDGIDAVNGGGGIDTLVINGNADSERFDLTAVSATRTVGAGAAVAIAGLTSVEAFSVSAGAGADTIVSGAGSDVIDGGTTGPNPNAEDAIRDVVIYAGNQADYSINRTPTATFVTHIASGAVDTVTRVEALRFDDGDFLLVNTPATGTVTISDTTPTEGQQLTLTANIQDVNGVGPFSYQWQRSTDNGTTWTNIGGATNASYTPVDNVFGVDDIGNRLRVNVSFVDGFGYSETISSAATEVVGDVLNGANGVSLTLNGTAGADVITGGNPVTIPFVGTFGGNDSLNGNAGADTLNGGAGNDNIVGGAGNDSILGGTGSDNIRWAAGDGRDIVNGAGAAANDTGVDTFFVTGNTDAETFRIYSRAFLDAPANAGVLAAVGPLQGGTEIVITRTVGAVTEVVAELDNIEELNINASLRTTGGNVQAGTVSGDTIQIFGSFAGTSLLLNTITIEGSADSDTIDISSLQSAHRIVFRGSGGNDVIVGTLRPQDVIEVPTGTPADYTETTNPNGTRTLSNGTNSITFLSTGMPTIVAAGTTGHDDDEPDTDEDNSPGNDDGEGDDNSAGNGTGNGAGNGTGNGIGNGSGTVTQPPLAAVAAVATANADALTGSAADDHVQALAGDDAVVTHGGSDVVSGGEGSDIVHAGSDADIVAGGAGDDLLLGGSGADDVFGDAGSDRIWGGEGDDRLSGGAGNDTVFGGAGNDLVSAEKGDGDDVYWGEAGVDTYDASVSTANLTIDVGTGFGGRGRVVGADIGSDTIWGFENVVAGSGNDTITASNAANVLDGGAGNDVFRFLSASGADGDTILGFEPGDRLDLSGIDANAGTTAGDAFTLVNGSSFSAAGQLLVTFETTAEGDFTVVQGNTDANTADAEFTLRIAGHHELNASNTVF